VVTLDLAGHGASGVNRTGWTIEAFGADVAAVVEKLDLRDVILVGHSMGADVVTDAARRLPGRVKGVIWLDQYNELDTQLSDEKVAEIVGPFRADFSGTTQAFVRGMFPANADPALVERVAADMASAPPEIAVPMLVATKANSRNIAAAVAALDVPVVTINAGNSPTNVQALAHRGVKAIVMPGTGHFLMMDDPDGFNTLLKQTIAEQSEVRR
jgi:pimeloyl-ACP methyl ester carboxylesterase